MKEGVMGYLLNVGEFILTTVEVNGVKGMFQVEKGFEFEPGSVVELLFPTPRRPQVGSCVALRVISGEGAGRLFVGQEVGPHRFWLLCSE